MSASDDSAHKSSKDFKFAIVGGGVCGLTLAVALLERGCHVDIYEAAPAFGEIGAGVAFGPNATRALKKCSANLLAAFDKVATRNQTPSKSKTWFDWIDGYHGDKWCFALENDTGANSVHRASFLDELVKLIPEGVSHFGKRLVDITESQDGKMELRFVDGSTAMADAVIGCDGIKSQTRKVMLGAGHPCLHPVYTQKYAYRGLIPMDKAVERLGDDMARNAYMFMGVDGHMLTFPVNKGAVMNVVAFKVDTDDWPDESKFVLPSTKQQALDDFADFGDSVHAILHLIGDNVDRWAIYDLGDAPLPTYCQKRLCLIGDAAHATSPHHGAGAGFGIEDAAVLAELLHTAVNADPEHTGPNVELAFKAYDASRRERTQWLVQSSRRVGDMYEWRADGVGRDVEKIHQELKWRCEKIWHGNIEEFVKAAREDLLTRINLVGDQRAS